MKTFNKLFNTSTTQVMLAGEYTFNKVVGIHESRKWIKVEGFEGSFQRCDIVEFTNKLNPKSIEETPQYRFEDGSLYEFDEGSNAYIHVYKHARHTTQLQAVAAYEELSEA